MPRQGRTESSKKKTGWHRCTRPVSLVQHKILLVQIIQIRRLVPHILQNIIADIVPRIGIHDIGIVRTVKDKSILLLFGPLFDSCINLVLDWPDQLLAAFEQIPVHPETFLLQILGIR